MSTLNQVKTFFLLFSILLLLSCIVPVFSIQAETFTKEKRTQDEEKKRKGDFFNMIFGPVPSMPTERGLLLINAFHDENGNQAKDPEEKELRNEIVCRVDGIQYRIPAFIPALKLHENYRVECGTEENSMEFFPEMENTELFVQRRGQVISIELPCRRLESKESPPS